MSKSNFIYETIFFFLIIIVLSLQIYLTIIFDKINLSSIQSLVNNWMNGPVIHLFTSNESKCPNDCNILENQSWKGTVSGGRNYLGQIIRMPNNSTGFGVNAIKSIPEQNITHWKKQLLCGERMPVKSYFDLNIISPGNVCPPYYKMCSGTIDSLGNRLCIPENNLCPINSIIRNIIFDYNDVKGQKERYLWYEDEFYYYVNDDKDNEDQIVLKDFIFSEGTPCIDQSYANMTEEPHILDYFYFKSKCPFNPNGTVFIELDSYPKRLFYYENNITNKLIKLPEYKKISNTIDIGLYYRGYAGINRTCLEDMTFQHEIPFLLLQLMKDLNKCFNWSTITVLVDSIAFILLLTSYSAEVTHVLIQKEKKPPYAKPVLMITTIFSVIFSCVLFANITSIPKPLIKIFENDHCIDPNTLTLMYPITHSLHLVKLYIWIILGVNILLTLRYGLMPVIKYAT